MLYSFSEAYSTLYIFTFQQKYKNIKYGFDIFLFINSSGLGSGIAHTAVGHNIEKNVNLR